MKPSAFTGFVLGRDWLVPVSLFLLVVARLGSDSRLIQAMQGISRIERELQPGVTLGYYETILNAGETGNHGAEVCNSKDIPGHPGFVPFGAANIVEAIPTYIRWKIRPNLALRWNGSTFCSSSLGYRTPEIDLPKPGNVYRILVFGSSNTMGHGVDDDVVYPRLLETWLNQQFDTGIRVEVVNLAVSGDSPSRRLQRIRDEAGRFQADWILCDASPLDYSLEESHLEAVIRSTPPIEIPFEYVREVLLRAEVSAQDSPEEFRLKIRGEMEELFDGSIAGWKEEADRLGVPLSLVILPRADRKSQSSKIVALIRSLADRNGIDVIDISRAFDDLELDEFRVSEQDKHPSALGHQALFEELQSALVDRGGLPGLSLPTPHDSLE